MRGKVAKALRRQARAATKGQPARAYVSRQHVVTRNTTRVVEAKNREDAGKDGFWRAVRGIIKWYKREPITVRVTSEEIRLDPTSTKGYYRYLKRQLRRGNHVPQQELAI